MRSLRKYDEGRWHDFAPSDDWTFEQSSAVNPAKVARFRWSNSEPALTGAS